MGLRVILKATKPKIPATKDDNKITNFELLTIVRSSKASSVIKIDIVKPIPAKNPTPKIDFQLISEGSLHQLD